MIADAQDYRLQTYFQPYNEQLYTLLGRDFKWD